MPSESPETTETGAAAEVTDQPAVTSESASSSTPAEAPVEPAAEPAAPPAEAPSGPTALSEPDRILAVGGGGFDATPVPAVPELSMVERIARLEAKVFGS